MECDPVKWRVRPWYRPQITFEYNPNIKWSYPVIYPTNFPNSVYEQRYKQNCDEKLVKCFQNMDFSFDTLEKKKIERDCFDEHHQCLYRSISR